MFYCSSSDESFIRAIEIQSTIFFHEYRGVGIRKELICGLYIHIVVGIA